MPKSSALPLVAAWIACIGVMPKRTITANCLALSPWGKIAASLPSTTRAPASTARRKLSRCTEPTWRSFSRFSGSAPVDSPIARVYSVL